MLHNFFKQISPFSLISMSNDEWNYSINKVQKNKNMSVNFDRIFASKPQKKQANKL